MPLVECEDTVGARSRRGDDDRCVGKSDPELAIGVDHLDGGAHFPWTKAFQTVGTIGDLVQKEHRSVDPHARGQQVVELGQDEGRQEQGAGVGFQSRSGTLVTTLR